MNLKRLVVMFALLVSALATGRPAWSQATVNSGNIQGTVTDAQGGVVANATVTISNKENGSVITLATNSSGTYSSGTLQPALYNVRIEAPSFKVIETTVVVQVGQVSVYNARLEVGASTSVVEVSGETIQVNTEQAQLAGTLTTEQIENLPINGRNFLDLAQLEPGVQIQDGGNFDPTKNGFSSISFGGRFGRSARIQVDGVDVSDENVGTTTEDIPASAISEFSVAQSTLDLSNSLTSSGAVNVVTKSGTNAFHGEGFGLFRDSSQAATFPGDGTTFQRSQYGGSFGGAIIKDKLFFFVDGEKILQHAAAGVLIGSPLDSFSGTFGAPFHDGEALGRIDYLVSKNVKAFARFNYFQNSDVGAFGGAATYSNYDNKDRTKSIVGGVDISQGSITHSFRASYLKFVNNITDSVIGSSEPFADLPVSLELPGGFATGPSDNAPQETIQSDRQVKYDGSKVWGNHIIRWGVDYNRIVGWSFASFFGITPLAVNFLGDTADTLTCPGGQTGASCPLNYVPDEVLIGNGQGTFTELKQFGKSSGGLGPDNRIGIYLGDSWKVRQNLTVTYGVRYVRDTNRTDSDLGPIPALNAVIPGTGNRVAQPNNNLAPQLGVAWDPKSDGKTVIRAGIGIYYDNTVFNDILFDRLLRLPTGAFFVDSVPCFTGSSIPVVFGGTVGNQVIPGGDATCGSALGTTLPNTAAFGTCAGITTASCIGQFQTAYQASFAANPSGPNAAFVPSAIANGQSIEGGLLAPAYRSPQSLQMNVGFQRELRPGMVLSVDYLRNVGTHYLLDIDYNHTGDTAFFNLDAAQSAIASTNAHFGCAANFSEAATNCAIAAGAVMDNYVKRGLGSAANAGTGSGLANTPTGQQYAFGGVNPNIGSLELYAPVGRSVYNGLDFKLVQNVKNPFRGVRYLNFQATYTLSRFNNAGSGTSNSAVSGGDQDFLTAALDNNNPLRYSGPSSLDRTHQISFGGYADLPKGFRLGLISHFWSPLATTPTVPTTDTVAGIFQNDYNGDGTNSDPLPRSVSGGCGTFGGSCDYSTYKVGAFGRNLKAGSLANAVNNYNTAIAGNPTPAGQLLINNSLFTLAQLQAVTDIGGVPTPFGGVTQSISPVVPGQVNMGWFRATDIKFSWVGHIKERFTLEPSVGFFNIFNFSNFDSAGNALVGTLNGTTGSINGTVQAGRPDRIGVGSGAFNFGSPRVIEWGLKLNF